MSILPIQIPYLNLVWQLSNKIDVKLKLLFFSFFTYMQWFLQPHLNMALFDKYYFLSGANI